MTAYEVRMSDWSSDVCSSDLAVRHTLIRASVGARSFTSSAASLPREPRLPARRNRRSWPHLIPTLPDRYPCAQRRKPMVMIRHGRSEEHTSELQSLMRISYAVFCLKKKNKHTSKTYTQYT